VPACDVAIIGAGPYGLATAAHLRTDDRLDIRVFGEPMSFWTDRMPSGMLLRSPYIASNIADPDDALTLDAYQAASGNGLTPPVPLDRFVDYGRWFQRQVAPNVDRRWVSRVERQNGAFRLALADGESITARRTVVAAGIGPFANIPESFRYLPPSLGSHSSAHPDLGVFAGKQVLVVGGGQSALESAALLREAGADAEVVVREPRVFFLGRFPRLHNLGPLTRLVYAPPDVGPAGISRLVAAPNLYRRLPRRLQDVFAVRSIRPAGAAWLAPRLEGIPITTGSTVATASAAGDRVRVKLADGSSRLVDHVLLATGFAVDIERYAFLAPKLLADVDRVGGYPRLSATFETSVPGLHVIGAPSAWSFGPLMRFVAGTEIAAPTLARAVLGKRSARLPGGAR
jgi:NADPH-dependent 2,4-dienoyl-CoA reductase/sulfur reductase-like enzyme